MITGFLFIDEYSSVGNQWTAIGNAKTCLILRSADEEDTFFVLVGLYHPSESWPA